MKFSPPLRLLLLLGSLLLPASFSTKPLYAQRIICCPPTDTQNSASPIIPPAPEDANLPYPGNDEVRDQRQGMPGTGANGQPTG